MNGGQVIFRLKYWESGLQRTGLQARDSLVWRLAVLLKIR